MTARPNPRTNRSTWLLLAAKAIVTFALLGWLLARIELGPVLARLSSIDAGWAVAAVAIMAAQILLTGWRWALIARVIGAPLAIEPALRLTLVGHFFSQTLPSAIGGDAVRGFLAAREGMPGTKAASSVIIDRGTALVLMVVLIGVLLPLFFARVPDPAWRTGVSILVAASIGGLAVFLLIGERAATLLGRHRFTAPFATLARELRRVLVGAPESKIILITAIIVHLLVATGAYTIAQGLGIAISLVDCWVMIPPVVLLTTLPISIAGWGVREGATVALLGFVGVTPADALATSVAFGLVLIVVGIPGGVLWLRAQRSGPRTAGSQAP
jgi:glycosyltransferase 2 family protein